MLSVCVWCVDADQSGDTNISTAQDPRCPTAAGWWLVVAGSSASYFMLLAELVIVFFVLKIDIYIQTPRGGL